MVQDTQLHKSRKLASSICSNCLVGELEILLAQSKLLGLHRSSLQDAVGNVRGGDL